MARSVPWRRACPDQLDRCFEEAARVTLYIVHQTGPTGFILKEDGSRKKVKVLVHDDNVHVRDCHSYQVTIRCTLVTPTCAPVQCSEEHMSFVFTSCGESQ